MAEEKKDPSGSPVQKHKVLLDLDQQLQGEELSEVVEFRGHKFTLGTFGAQEESWCRAFLDINSPASFIASQRLPRLAASLQSIDNASKDDLFSLPEDSTPGQLQALFSSNFGKRQWQLNQLLDWLSKKPNDLVDALWEGYSKLDNRRRESLAAVKKSSTGTPSGESKPSSSPEKESSSATQTSQG